MRSSLALSRRHVFELATATAGTLLFPKIASADGKLVDPYIGAIPLISPLASGAYQLPLQDNWHALREGHLYDWNHRASTQLRCHDGVDLYPSGSTLPPVYSPLHGMVAAVCTRSDNTPNAMVTYLASSTTPPPWDYHAATDDVAQLPLYGNFIWLYSTDPASAGYFVFLCHLQNEAAIQALRPDDAVTATTPLAVMGDTGNASGTPQLHVEIHYPNRATYICGHCAPTKATTSIDPYASLVNATLRSAPAVPAQAMGLTLGQTVSGALAGQSGGAFVPYVLNASGHATITVTLAYNPFDAALSHGVGCNVYQNGVKLGGAGGQATGLGDPVNSSTISLTVAPGSADTPITVQVFNYSSDTIRYALTAT